MLFQDQGEWIELSQGKLFWHPHFLDQSYADALLEQYLTQLTWRQESIVMFGKSVQQPRLQAWYGDKSYRYSGLTMPPRPWTESLTQLKALCERQANCAFNSVLANQYRNGEDSMGYHQDNEPELGQNPIIASVSLGATRRFNLKHIHTKQTLSLDLTHGSLLIMAGELQHYWKHALPKARGCQQTRVNLTFRKIGSA